MSAPQRFVEIDALKTAGISTIVLVHCIRSQWDPLISPLEAWLGHLTRFGVPAFLFASGFLYATTGPVSWTLTARRLRRILIPYWVVSLAAQIFWRWLGLPTEVRDFWPDLAFGASMGPFYYVFVITGLVVATPLIAALSARALLALTALMIGAQWYTDVHGFDVPFFWHLRNPLLWWAYFLIGWQIRLRHASVSSWLAPRSRWLIPTTAIAIVALAITSGSTGPPLAIRTAAWLNVYAILLFVYAIACGRSDPTGSLRYFSDATYAVFLLHLFFVTIAQLLIPARPLFADFAPIALPWLAGVVGSLAILELARAGLGARSRDVVGG